MLDSAAPVEAMDSDGVDDVATLASRKEYILLGGSSAVRAASVFGDCCARDKSVGGVLDLDVADWVTDGGVLRLGGLVFALRLSLAGAPSFKDESPSMATEMAESSSC